ncbi:transposase [Streptomyces sp. NPDC005566]|uniref:transposase n=1 Tax=Streptomyces sp. NPDC005566 TaxID=3156886 RepID=UPI0033AFDA8F
MSLRALDDAVRVESLSVLSGFRSDFYECLTARAVALFRTRRRTAPRSGPVRSLVDLTLAPEHRRGHGALYGGLNCGRIGAARLRAGWVGLPLPRMYDGRIVLAVDVSPRLRSDASTSSDWLFCDVYGRTKRFPHFRLLEEPDPGGTPVPIG